MKILKQNNYILFLIITALYILVTYCGELLLINPELFFTQFKDQITFSKAEELFNLQQRFSYLGLMLIPILFLIKFLILTAIIQVGVLLENLEITFKDSFEIILQAEIIFIVLALLKVIWFYFFHTNFTMTELQEFHPLSLFQFFGDSELKLWFKYPLQLLNLFELLYIVTISFLISKKSKLTFIKGLNFTIKYYGSGLLIWIIIVSFFSINF